MLPVTASNQRSHRHRVSVEFLWMRTMVYRMHSIFPCDRNGVQCVWLLHMGGLEATDGAAVFVSSSRWRRRPRSNQGFVSTCCWRQKLEPRLLF